MSTGGWLRGVALRIVPTAWRDSVRDDLDEDTARGTVAHWRASVEVAAVGIGLHWTFTRGAVMSDVRYATRSLLYARWFTLGAVLTFAIGIGVNGAVFAAVDRVLFRPLPYDSPDRIVLISPTNPKTGTRFTMMPSAPVIEARHDSGGPFVDIATVGYTDEVALTGATQQPPLHLTDASYNLTTVLGVTPMLGQPFTHDDAVAKVRLVLLREEVWRGRFGAASDIIGRRFTDGTGTLEIRGVLRQGFVIPTFNWATPSDGLVLSDNALDTAGSGQVPAPVARLKAGVTAAQAQAAFDVILAATEVDTPAARRVAATIEPVRIGIYSSVRTSLVLLFLGGALVWLVACANLGTLLVARGRSRDQTVAIRLALGASAGRIVSSTLIESALLAVSGAALAIGMLALSMGVVIRALNTATKPLLLTAIDARLVTFALIATVLGVLIASVGPAYSAIRAVPQRFLTVARHSRSVSHVTLGRALLVTETALTSALVLAGVLAVASFVQLLRADLGFTPRDLYDVEIAGLSRVTSPEAKLAQQREALAALRRVPLIDSAGAVDSLLLRHEAPVGGAADPEGHRVGVQRVTEGFFDVMHPHVMAGRLLSDAEILECAPVVVLSHSGGALLFPDILPASLVDRTVTLSPLGAVRIVGVIDDFRTGQGDHPTPVLFAPAAPSPRRPYAVVARSRAGASLDPRSLRGVLTRDLGSSVSVRVTPVVTYLEPSLRDPRLTSQLFGAFAVVALVLAAVGLFAMTSFDVALRRYEVGVRMTLGAGASEIRRLIIGDALRPVCLGLAIGGVGAFWSAKFFQSLLPNLSARNPLGYATVAIVLLATAVAAAFVPARRAARVDPAIVLRAQ